MKKTSYQKLKDENKQLKQDLYNIVMKPKELIGMETLMKYNLSFAMSNAILSGRIQTVEHDYDFSKPHYIITA